jgi:thiamine-monophosphate kinase
MAVDDEISFLRWLRETDREGARFQVGLGDDACVLSVDGASIVVAADALAEGSHFEPDADPWLVGRKALAVNLSDLAAMGAEPLAALVTAAFPRGFDGARARRITEGMRALGAETDCPLVGGDTITHDGHLVLSVTILGRLLPGGPITRGGASAGDRIGITGAIGGSSHGRHLTFEPRLSESRRLLALGPPSAMIDVSDGLLLDLHRIADASDLGFRLDADRIPIHPDASDDEAALGDGEDFELLFCAPPEVMTRILGGWDLPVPVTDIGVMTAPGSRTMLRGQRLEEAPVRGYRHG